MRILGVGERERGKLRQMIASRSLLTRTVDVDGDAQRQEQKASQ